MNNDFAIVLPWIAVGLGVPCLGILVSFFATSRVAVAVLRWGGGYFFVALAVSTFLVVDCDFDNYTFQRCSYIPDFVAEMLTISHFVNGALFVFLGPVLLLVAFGFELRKRFAGSGKSPMMSTD